MLPTQETIQQLSDQAGTNYKIFGMRFIAIASATARGGVRDRLFLAVFFLGILLIGCLLFLSDLSMRQPLETAITYTLSSISVTGVLLTLFLGINLISSEIENKTIYPILALPIPRSTYIIGKFSGLFILLAGLTLVLGVCGSGGLALIAAQKASIAAVAWHKIAFALTAQVLSLTLLGAVTIFFTSVATSSTFPFLLSCAVYAIGQASGPVKDFLASAAGQELFPPWIHTLVTGIFYTFPDFQRFNFQTQAIYNLSLAPSEIISCIVYWMIYTSLLITASICIFQRRDLL